MRRTIKRRTVVASAEKPSKLKKTQSTKPEDTAAATVARYKAKVTNPISAIRAFCVQCMNGAVRSIKTCSAHDTCALHPFRMGVNLLDARSIRAAQKREAKKSPEFET